MPRIVAALAALLTLTACASTGAQTVDALPHADRKPAGAHQVTAAEVVAENRCYGDGQDGKRVQAVYVVAADRPDRYAQLLPSILTWMANADAALNESAQKRGGTAHIRWACRDGAPYVAHFVGTTAVDGDVSNTRSELKAAGYVGTDRKFLSWVDGSGYCGVAYTTTNPEGSSGYARVDSGCWGMSAPVELHELAHTLGAVPLSAVDSDGGWHCSTSADRMCYGGVQVQKCPAAEERHLDCGNDSYADWSATPNPMPLNLARSGYFESTYGGGTPSPTPTTVSPSPTPTTASPTPTVTPSRTPTVTASPTPSPLPSKACGKSQRPGCRS